MRLGYAVHARPGLARKAAFTGAPSCMRCDCALCAVRPGLLSAFSPVHPAACVLIRPTICIQTRWHMSLSACTAADLWQRLFCPGRVRCVTGACTHLP
jgi:hypothetical protein